MGNPKQISFQIDVGLILVNSRLLVFEIFDPRTNFSHNFGVVDICNISLPVFYSPARIAHRLIQYCSLTSFGRSFRLKRQDPMYGFEKHDIIILLCIDEFEISQHSDQ